MFAKVIVKITIARFYGPQCRISYICVKPLLLFIIIINEIYIALSLQVATQLRNGAANVLKQLCGVTDEF